MQILDKTNPVTGTSNPCNFLDEIKGYQHSVVFITVALILLFSLEPYAQNVPTSTKIDPLYRQLISESKNDKVLLNGAPFSSRVEATEGYAIKNGPMEKRYECIVYTNNAPALRGKGITINSTLPSFVTAWITLEQISEMAAMDFIKYIEAPRTDYLHNDVSVGNTGASLLHQGNLNNTAYKGKNVLVAIYDSGIDWDHFDFRDPNDTSKSRIIRIWDQTLTAVTGEAPPSGFSYGVEYTQTQINDELDGTPANIVRERDFNGHGTHVAGTAAGNGSAKTTRKYMGLAPEADLIIIKGGESSFSTNRIIDGITYLQNLATSLGKPLVMNMSLGGQFGPHDGTRSYEIAVDNFTASAPGRAVVISAGNDNGTNLHNRITLAGNATTAIVFNVPASSLGTDVFEYRLYSKDSSAVSATVIPPDSVVNVTANAGEIAEGLVLTDSFSVQLSNFVDISNNSRFVDVYVDRVGSNTKSPAGTWTLSITNNTANTLAIDGWLYYRNASFGPTSLVGGNSDYLVGSPGNANSAITVASFAGRNGWYSNAAVGAFTFPNTRVDSISSFSSRGPRRDEVLKPEIAANGEVVVSSLSSNNTSYTSSSITDVGLYVKNQGTSMSAPVTTGAVALLMQANPAVTSAQIKGYITATANKDVMTELTATTPNPSWGYGRLDVFKAASAMFNCTPAERRTYQYDSSTRNAQEMGTTLSTQRAGVRFTPDINGKLGGVFFNTSTAATGLNLQVRANNAGNPGDLLGSVNIDSAQVARYSWNYVDLSNLNITTANGVDYFIILSRTGSSNWSLRGEALALDNRSYLSSDDGTTWSAFAGADFKIRSVVYSNAQSSGAIATVNSIDTRNLNTSNLFINNNCAAIMQVVPSGVSPLSGDVSGKVWLEPMVQTHAGGPYVTRHYEVEPITGGLGSTGKITLYFTQSEFNDFNADPGSTFDLPSNSTDGLGKSNLRIGQYKGTSHNNTGLPASYNGTANVIDPADGDIDWNQEFSRWEISFDVTGMGGFILQTSTTALPITLQFFRGESQSSGNFLKWKANCENSSVVFEIERSNDGSNFNNIGSISATRDRCTQAFDFTDASPLEGKDYYRIRITESTGRFYYTPVILLQSGNALPTTLFPTVIAKGAGIQVRLAGKKGNLNVHDGSGRKIYETNLMHGSQSISLLIESAGLYFYTITDEKGSITFGKLVVR